MRRSGSRCDESWPMSEMHHALIMSQSSHLVECYWSSFGDNQSYLSKPLHNNSTAVNINCDTSRGVAFLEHGICDLASRFRVLAEVPPTTLPCWSPPISLAPPAYALLTEFTSRQILGRSQVSSRWDKMGIPIDIAPGADTSEFSRTAPGIWEATNGKATRQS
jgi:hypothetical protein